MDKVRWGVLGYARIAKTCMIPALKHDERSELHAIATRNSETTAELLKGNDFKKVYQSYDELLDDPEVDVVYVPLPNSLHREWAIRAMRKGKHVLCEKPMTITRRDAEEMVAVARECNVLLVEALMYRFLDKSMVLRSILEDNVIGDVRMVKSSWRFLLNRVNTIKEKPSLGGGSLYDVGCYPVSLINTVFDELPVEVKSHRNINENGVDVSISAILKYRNGAMAQFDAGFDSFSYKCTEISGTKGSILIPETYVDEDYPILVKLSDEPKCRKYVSEVQNRYSEEVKAVNEAVLKGEKELISLDYSIRNAALLEIVMNSH